MITATPRKLAEVRSTGNGPYPAHSDRFRRRKGEGAGAGRGARAFKGQGQLGARRSECVGRIGEGRATAVIV